jgi:hypothetical protein
MAGTRMPSIVPLGTQSGSSFGTYNSQRAKYADSSLITLAYNPAAHMPDEDTFMENVPTVLDWVNSIRAFAPNARFRFDPIGFNSPYPRPAADPRNVGLFAAAWCARVVKYLALGGVEEAAFIPNTKYAAAILGRVAPFAGARVLKATVSPGTPAPVDVLAVEGNGKMVLWLINLTDRTQRVAVEGLGKVKSLRFTAIRGGPEVQRKLSSVTLLPYDVIEIVAEK